MNRKKQAQTELSYYGLYLLNHLRENRFPQASDADFIRERADHILIVERDIKVAAIIDLRGFIAARVPILLTDLLALPFDANLAAPFAMA